MIGKRGDLLLQKGMTEYSCAEAGANSDGPKRSQKKMLEKWAESPKMLKDMLKKSLRLHVNRRSSSCQIDDHWLHTLW